MKIKTIVISSLAVLTLASGIVGFSNVLKQNVKNGVSYKNWMSSVSDSTLIKDLNIPGSHDTMALYSIADLAGQCQSLSLSDQLNLGIRFLDIRLQLINNELRAVHGIVDQRSSFAQIISNVESFLKDNESEFIIMSVKEESKAKNSTIGFETALKEHVSDYWITDASIPGTVGSVRKKIVLLSRYENSTIGIPAYAGWKNSETFTLDNGVYVQDEYKVKDINEKKTAIVNCFDKVIDNLKINFLSGYLTNGFPPSYAPSVAKDINPWINDVLKTHENNRGIVLYDFVTSNLMKGWFE